MLIVTGMNRISTCLTRGSRQSQTNESRNSILRSADEHHQELHDGRHQPRDRVRVDLVVAVEAGMERDQPGQDHQVPDRRRDRRDRELVVGLEDPDEQSGEAEQQHDREQHARQARGQRVAECDCPVNSRHDQTRDQRPDHSERAERDQDHPEQRRGDAERLALAALAEQLGEDRHERGRQRRLREQVAEQVRDLGGERERRRRGRCGEVRGLDDLAPEPGDPGERGGEREDRRVDGDPPARRRRCAGSLGRCARPVGRCRRDAVARRPWFSVDLGQGWL